MGNTQLKVHVDPLVDLELVLAHRGEHGEWHLQLVELLAALDSETEKENRAHPAV